MFKCKRGESKADLVVIFRIPQGKSTPSTDLIQKITAASREALAQLLRPETSDEIFSIWSTVGSNSILATTLLSTLIPDGMYSILCDTKSENDFVQEI